ncbi:MAG: helix-turn-helix transcriptional regulator [Ruminococcaceae bacterium]|nr:helix-turn-helix transcriptional regulator [Oscillospiraceae bacterium]
MIAFFFFFDTFSMRLRISMEKQHIDIKTLSTRSDVSMVTVKRWLRGMYEPRHATLPKIANVLNVSTDYLCCRED